jgi:acyl carrier protein
MGRALSRREVVEGLREFIRRELLMDPSYPLAEDEPLITGGLIDSFLLAHVAVYVETAFGVYVPDADLTTEDVDTVGRMADLVMAWHGLSRTRNG